MNFALREAGAEVFADRLDVSSDVETLRIRRLIQLLLHSGDCAYTERCVFKVLGKHGVGVVARLKAQHSDDQRQAILNSMVHLLDEKLMPLQSRPQTALVPFALDGHPQKVGGTRQEREIMPDEFVSRSAVNLQYAKWLTISLQDHVHGAANAMSVKNLGCAEALLDFEVNGDSR